MATQLTDAQKAARVEAALNIIRNDAEQANDSAIASAIAHFSVEASRASKSKLYDLLISHSSREAALSAIETA